MGLVAYNKGSSQSCWPLCLKKKSTFFRQIITQPTHTPFLGPWFHYTDDLGEKERTKASIESVEAMLEKIPSYSYFGQAFHPSITNWLPMYWNGFEATTNYTYVIDSLQDIDTVYGNFSRLRKRLIKKTVHLKLEEDLDPAEFYAFHKQSLEQQGKTVSYSVEHLRKIVSASYNNKSGKTMCIRDDLGNLLSAVFFVWDERSAYYLVSATSNNPKDGSLTRLVWEAMQFLQDKTVAFDFEGSMIRNVESVFRSFGARQQLYFSVNRYRSKVLHTGLMLKKVWL